MRVRNIKSIALIFMLSTLVLFMACSRDTDWRTPTAPELPGPAFTLTSDDWDTYYSGSLTNTYTTLNAMINGLNGGELTGTVSGYDDEFSILVPAGAYSGMKQLSIKVPTSGLPIYQLLPHGTTFSDTVTVTLDYDLWLDSEDMVDGDEYEILYMNEATEDFDQLSPPATFTADEDNPQVSFGTLHFSRWVIEKADEE